MADIATVFELASSLQSDLDTATESLWLLDLAQGLVAEVIGVQSPWPATAKAVALAAAARASANPLGLKRETVGGVTAEYADGGGVYLTSDERLRLTQWLASQGATGRPVGYFPGYFSYPDSVERQQLHTRT